MEWPRVPGDWAWARRVDKRPGGRVRLWVILVTVKELWVVILGCLMVLSRSLSMPVDRKCVQGFVVVVVLELFKCWWIGHCCGQNEA